MYVRPHKYVCFCLICLLLTACMGSSKEEVDTVEYGVVASGARKNIRTESGLLITAPEIDNTDMEAGDCFLLAYRGAREDFGQGKEVEVKILKMDAIGKHPFVQEPTDTAILRNEEALQRVAFAGSRCVYGNLFIQTHHGITLRDEVEYFELSRDGGIPPSVGQNGKPLYDLFLRVVKEDGTDTLQQTQSYISAFDIRLLLDSAQTYIDSNGDERIAMRLNYVSGFNVQDEKPLWTVSDTLFLLK